MSKKRRYVTYTAFLVALVMFLLSVFHFRPSTKSIENLNNNLQVSILRYSWKKEYRTFYIDLEPPMHFGPSNIDVLLVELELENISGQDVTFSSCFARGVSERIYESEVFGEYHNYLTGLTKIKAGHSVIGLKAFEVDKEILPLSIICSGSESVNQITSSE